MYLHETKLVIEFYFVKSATFAVTNENGATIMGSKVHVSPLKPWNEGTLGRLIERIPPQTFHGYLPGVDSVPPDSHLAIPYIQSAGNEPRQGLSAEVTLKKVVAESRFLNNDQLKAVYDVLQALRAKRGFVVTESTIKANTIPWLTADHKLLLKSLRMSNERRQKKRNPVAEIAFRDSRNAARRKIEQAKTDWLKHIDEEILNC